MSIGSVEDYHYHTANMTTLTLGHHYLKSALFLAHASYAAYEDDPRTTYEGFQDFQFSNVFPFTSEKTKNNGATSGFLAERDDAIVLAFKGTDIDEIEDWAININCFQVSDNGANVHEGFVMALASVWDKISDRIREMVKQKKRKIWITGHSLGGALATLATRRLLNMQVGQIETHTFGQPRVGDKEMKKQIPSNLFYRFAYESDPVTFLPFEAMGYTHVGTLKLIDASGQVHEDASNWLSRIYAGSKTFEQIIKDTRDSSKNDLKAFVHKMIKNHLLPNYIEKIAQAMQK